MSYQFMGFRRPDGRVGARNLVGVIPSVTCANDVAQAIVTEVQGTVGYFHHQGCCQLPPDLDRVTETLTSLGQSPNLGAVLIVSLGCEGTDFEKMYKTIEATGKPVRIIGIQELGGVSNAIQKGIASKKRCGSSARRGLPSASTTCTGRGSSANCSISLLRRTQRLGSEGCAPSGSSADSRALLSR